MRREPSLTVRGALTILGRHEPQVITKLDNLLGGVILAVGAGTGLAAVGIPVLAPLASLAAIWGWVDQKEVAVGLLSQAVKAIQGKLIGVSGYERRQLISAAHTTIAIAAFFESLREYLGDDSFNSLKMTDEEKRALATGNWSKVGSRLLESLYLAEVPAPSPARGYDENIEEIRVWARRLGEDFTNFIRGLEAGEKITINWQAVSEKVAERYSSHYLILAASSPEFMAWAMLGEHAATRDKIAGMQSDLIAALNANRRALGRVEALLAVQSAEFDDAMDLRLVVNRANQGVLSEPIVPTDAERYGTPVNFPKVASIYINPRYRLARADDDARPADESWWEAKQSFDDIDLALAAYVMAPDATRLPMLLLGHPGAGKSLLTKVLAARLPGSTYTVIRVSLRQVGANAPIIDQIQQALDLATNRRVDWWRLAEQSHDTVRVILLDGLDELLQASSNDRSGYLQDVIEFQRIEAEQERPVVVIVTSRTVVADRVDIPTDTTVVKLDYFNKDDIEDWLEQWRQVNASLISSGVVREFTEAAALRHAELARQPLLLLMLALYSADPTFPALDSDISTANLYRRLFDNFARREVAKRAGKRLSSDETERRTQDQIDRLSIAALAMFNRKRQDVTEIDLGSDMVALNEDHSTSAGPVELGQRLIGEFFFVHAAEMRPFSKSGPTEPTDTPSSVLRRDEHTKRSYEFLHATFGEYLVASRVLNELVDVASSSFATRRGSREPNDDLLFALLSHQPLAVRRSTVNFAMELFSNFPRSDRSHVLAVLDNLIGYYRHRYTSPRYANYRPTPADAIRQLAAYSANLITLRVALEPGMAMVPLDKLLSTSDNPLRTWRSTVNLWHSGLDSDGLQAVIASLSFSDGSIRFAASKEIPSTSEMLEIWSAQLIDNAHLETQLRFGAAVTDQLFYMDDDRGDWADMMASWLIPYTAGVSKNYLLKIPPPVGMSDEAIVYIAKLITRLLKYCGGELDLEADLIRLLLDLPRVFELDTHALAVSVTRHPVLVSMIPELQDPATFGESWDAICMAVSVSNMWGLDRDSEESRRATELRNWRSRFLSGELLKGEAETIMTMLLRAYFDGIPGV